VALFSKSGNRRKSSKKGGEKERGGETVKEDQVDCRSEGLRLLEPNDQRGS